MRTIRTVNVSAYLICGDFVTYLPHGFVALIDMEDDARNNLEQARQESKH